MPSRNSTKLYVENSYYHLYNRGIEKRDIFLDKQDYDVFLAYLKGYLLPKDDKGLTQSINAPDIPYKEKEKLIRLLHMNNFSQEISLLAYCLMPNHFHFFVKQKNTSTIDKFMNSMGTRYTMYFNRRYNRIGPLYQGVYKAVLVNDEGHFLHLSRYIHKQAVSYGNQPCSYPEYTGARNTPWINSEEILAHFSSSNPTLSYARFVKENDDFEILRGIALE
jgi:putative transposase